MPCSRRGSYPLFPCGPLWCSSAGSGEDFLLHGCRKMGGGGTGKEVRVAVEGKWGSGGRIQIVL